MLAIDEVTVVELAAITDDDARAAGFASRREALADLRPEGTLYRIRFHRLDDDPRIALRHLDVLDEAEWSALRQRLDHLDWAVPTLRLIGTRPATVSSELAARLDVERAPFKQRVRRLKALGLTESLEVGYRLSPRGRTILRRIDDAPAVEPDH